MQAPRLEGRVARLAAYGGYAVVVVLLVLLALLARLVWPVPTGGMNAGMMEVTLITGGVIVLILSLAHIALSAQLLEAARRHTPQR